MKLKTLGYLAIAVAVLAGLAVIVFRPGDTTETESAMGQKLFENLMVRDIDRILITGNENQVTFENSEGGWGVTDRNGFPADFSRIAELVKKVQHLKVGRRFEVSEDIRIRLALQHPGKTSVPGSQKGTRVRFETGRGEPLVDLLVGKTRQSGTAADGQYVMPMDGSEVYLVDKTFRFLDTNPAEWVKRELLNIAPDKILQIGAYADASAEPLYVLVRGEQETDFTLKPPPATGQLDQTEVKRVVEALTPLRIEDAQSREKPLAGKFRLEYTLSDGRRYTVTIGEKEEADQEETFYLVDVDIGLIEREKGSHGQDSSGPPAPIEKEAEQLAKWTYLVSKWEIENFITDPRELVTPKEKE